MLISKQNFANANVSSLVKISDILGIFLLISIYIFSTNPEFNIIYKFSAIVFIGYVIFEKISRRLPVLITSYTLCSLTFGLICFFSLLWSYIVHYNTVIAIVFMIAITFALINYITSEREIEILLIGIVIAGIILSIFLYVNVGSAVLLNSRFVLKGYNSNDLGIKLAISCLAAIYLGIKKKKAYFLLLIILIPFVFFTESKKAFFLLFAGIAIYLILREQKSLKRLGIIAVVIIGFLIIWYLIFNVQWFYNTIGLRIETLLNQLFIGSGGSNSDRERIQMIEYGINWMKNKPILGYGIDNYRYLLSNQTLLNTYAHNNYIELLIDVGVFGTLAFYSKYVLVIKGLIKEYSKNIELISFQLTWIILICLMEVGLVTYNEIFYDVIFAIAFCAFRLTKQNAGMQKMESYCNDFKKINKNYNILLILLIGLFRFIPDRIYLKIKFKIIMNKRLNLKNPPTFNEKLQWLKIYDRNSEYTKMVDKYEVRKYIQDILGEEYSVPLLGVYNSFDEIDFNALPDRFVLKPNHTSGDIFICNDKSQIDHIRLKKETNKWLKQNYFWLHREWPYKNIKPKIICEEYIKSEDPKGLIDYKFMCFSGEVMCLFVCLNRNTELNVDFYDLNWNLMPLKRHYSNSGVKLDKPKFFNKMIELATILSKNLPFVRVDFYEANNKLYFGELTFYPGSGFEKFDPESYDYLLGSWIKLNVNEDF